MRALITASFHADGLAVCGGTWRWSTRTGARRRSSIRLRQVAARLREVGAEVLIVEADLVRDEMFDRLAASGRRLPRRSDQRRPRARHGARHPFCSRRPATPMPSPT
jgi:hypothetical protein